MNVNGFEPLTLKRLVFEVNRLTSKKCSMLTFGSTACVYDVRTKNRKRRLPLIEDQHFTQRSATNIHSRTYPKKTKKQLTTVSSDGRRLV